MRSISQLSKRLQALEASQSNETKVFLIDNIGRDGPKECSDEQLEILKQRAVAADPFKSIYVIDLGGNL